MNYPMKDGQIDPEFVENIRRNINNRGGEFFGSRDVKVFLIALQEVMQESRPEIKRGDTVTHNSRPDFGTGKVTSISESGKSADVYFESVGFLKPLVTSLTKVEEAQHGEG